MTKKSIHSITFAFVLFFNINANAGLWESTWNLFKDAGNVIKDVFDEAVDCVTSPIDCLTDQIDGIGDMWKICEDRPTSKYINFPINIRDTVHYIGGDTLGFMFENKCSPDDLKVTNLQEKVEYYWDEKSNYLDRHWHCNFRIVKVEYEVTCSNKLAYPGVKYLFSRAWSLNGDQFTDAESFKAEAHDWKNVPLEFLNSNSSVTKDPVDSSEWIYKPEQLNINSLKQT